MLYSGASPFDVFDKLVALPREQGPDPFRNAMVRELIKEASKTRDSRLAVAVVPFITGTLGAPVPYTPSPASKKRKQKQWVKNVGFI